MPRMSDAEFKKLGLPANLDKYKESIMDFDEFLQENEGSARSEYLKKKGGYKRGTHRSLEGLRNAKP